MLEAELYRGPHTRYLKVYKTHLDTLEDHQAYGAARLVTATFVQRQKCCWLPLNPNPTENLTQISNDLDDNKAE